MLKGPSLRLFSFAQKEGKKNPKQKEPAKPPPKIKYEDTEKFKALDRMMRKNKGVSGMTR